MSLIAWPSGHGSDVCSQRDRQFVHGVIESRRRLSDGDFSRLLRDHLSGDGAARRLVGAERHRLQQGLLGRLAWRESAPAPADEVNRTAEHAQITLCGCWDC